VRRPYMHAIKRFSGPKKGAFPTADLSNSISWRCQCPGMRDYTPCVP
jgi:hypothetical protein